MKASGASAPAAPLPQARTRRHSRAGVWLTLSTLPSCHGLRGLACLPDAPGAEAPVGGAAAARGAVVRHGPLRRDARPLEEAEAPPHGRDAGLLASTTLASSSGGGASLALGRRDMGGPSRRRGPRQSTASRDPPCLSPVRRKQPVGIEQLGPRPTSAGW